MRSFKILSLKISMVLIIILFFIQLRYFLNFPDKFSKYSQTSLINSIQVFVILIELALGIIFFKLSAFYHLKSNNLVELILLLFLATNIGSMALVQILSVSSTPYAPGGAMGDLGVHMAKSILASESTFLDVNNLAIDPVTYPVLWHMLVGLSSKILNLNILFHYKEIYILGSVALSMLLIILVLSSSKSKFLLLFLVLITYTHFIDWKVFSSLAGIIIFVLIYEELIHDEDYR